MCVTPHALCLSTCGPPLVCPVALSPWVLPQGHFFLLLIFLPWDKRGHWLSRRSAARGAGGGFAVGDTHWLTLASPHCCHWQLKWETINLAQSYHLAAYLSSGKLYQSGLVCTLADWLSGLHCSITARKQCRGIKFCSTLSIQCCNQHTYVGLFRSEIISSEF